MVLFPELRTHYQTYPAVCFCALHLNKSEQSSNQKATITGTWVFSGKELNYQ